MVPLSAKVWDTECVCIKEHYSYLVRKHNKRSKKSRGTWLDIFGQVWYNHEADVFVMYQGHVMILNFPAEFKPHVIDNFHTTVRCFPVVYEDDCDLWPAMTVTEVVLLEGGVPQTNTSKGHNEKLQDLHQDNKSMLHGLVKCPGDELFSSTSNRQRYKMFNFIAFYCCDVPETKDMSGIRNEFMAEWLCNRWHVGSNHLVTTELPLKWLTAGSGMGRAAYLTILGIFGEIREKRHALGRRRDLARAIQLH